MNSTSSDVASPNVRGSNVLVRVDEGGSMFEARPTEAIRDDGRVLALAYDGMPGDWYADYVAAAGDNPDRFAHVSVGGMFRSASADHRPAHEPYRGPIIDAVQSRSDLVGLCRRVEGFLDAWADDPPVVYLDSLTDLLRHVDPLPATRGLHVLTRKVRRAGATGVYRFDEGAHDERILDRLAPLFDDVRTVTGDAGPSP